MKTETNLVTGGANMARRSFLRYAGASAATVAVLGAASCKKDRAVGGGTDVGSGDIGILNLAYALEQLEAAFYIQVVATPYSGMSSVELSYFTDIRDHEVIHRDFFKTALGTSAIKSLTPDFTSITFGDRKAVLTAAKTFEDLGVRAYNSVGYLIQDVNYLLVAGKIVSVEARHAATISNLLSSGSFVADDQVDANGLNKTISVAEVLSAANSYLSTKITANSF